MLDKQDQQSNSQSPASPAEGTHDNWTHHEHIADLTHVHAQQLIESAGSADLAKHAVEVVAEEIEEIMEKSELAANDAAGREAGASSETQASPAAQSQLVQLLGYSSYLDLFESSKPAGEYGDRHWLITAETDGGWALWNDADYQISGRFKSQQAALGAAGAPAKKPRKPR